MSDTKQMTAIEELGYALRCDGPEPGSVLSAASNAMAVSGDYTLEAWVCPDPATPGLTLYSESLCGGTSRVLSPGAYRTRAEVCSEFEPVSLRVPPGWILYLFDLPGCRGRVTKITDILPTFRDFKDGEKGFQSALVIRPAAPEQEYALLSYGGFSQALRIGTYADLAPVLTRVEAGTPSTKGIELLDADGKVLLSCEPGSAAAVDAAVWAKTKSVAAGVKATLEFASGFRMTFDGPLDHIFEDDAARQQFETQYPYTVAAGYNWLVRYPNQDLYLPPGITIKGYAESAFGTKTPPAVRTEAGDWTMPSGFRSLIVGGGHNPAPAKPGAAAERSQPLVVIGENSLPRLDVTVVPPIGTVTPETIWFGSPTERRKLSRGVWTHVAVTRKGDILTYWVDGRAAGTAKSTPVPLTTVNASASFGGGDFLGWLGPVRLTSTAKSREDIAATRFQWETARPAAPSTTAMTAVSLDPHHGSLHVWFCDYEDQKHPESNVGRARYPRPALATSAAAAVQHRAQQQQEEQKAHAVSKAGERVRTAETKAMLALQKSHNETGARVAAGRLQAVWRVEDGQVSNIDRAGLIQSTPAGPMPPRLASGEVTALTVDHARSLVYFASRDSHGSGYAIQKWDFHTAPPPCCQAGATVHALAVDPQDGNVFWIEHPGLLKLWKPGAAQAVELTRFPAGTDDVWSLCVENQDKAGQEGKLALYCSNGREIWRAAVTGGLDAKVTDVTLHVAHGRSLRPVALAVDDGFDPASDPDRGRLFWVDRELALVRSIDSTGHIRSLYAAPCAREALSIDTMLGRIYWNAEHRPMLETAVIDDPGLFYWFEDRGEPGAHHQHIDVLRDLYESRVGFETDASLESWLAAEHPKWEHIKGNTPRRNLTFSSKDAGSHIEVGPLHLDCTHGFSIEAIVKLDGNTPWQRILDFGNGDENLNIILSRDATGKGLSMQVFRPGDRAGKTPVLTLADAPAGWQHIAVTISSNGDARIYRNGAVAATGTLPVPITAVRRWNYIGKGNAPNSPGFSGAIAMLRIWNRGLGEDAVSASFLDPFQELTHPDNPLEIFEEHLFHYDRSLVEHRDGRLWLMSGVLNGEWEPVPLVEMAVDSGLALQSAALQNHDRLLKAHYERAKAQTDKYAQTLAAKKSADSLVKSAEGAAAKRRNEAALHVSDAKTDADAKRRDAHARRLAEVEKQHRLVAAQKENSRQVKARGRTESEEIEQKARADKSTRVADANRRLDEARNERSKH